MPLLTPLANFASSRHPPVAPNPGAALEQALWLFKQTGSRDFADCLHIALVSQAGQGPFLTLDDRASKVEGGPWGQVLKCSI